MAPPVTRSSSSRRTTSAVAAVLAAAALVAGTLAIGDTVAGAATRQEEACFIDRGHQVFLDRSATTAELSTWLQAFAAGTPRSSMPVDLARSDEWLEVEVTKIYRQALDRDPDPAGLAYWVDELRRGGRVTRIGSLVFGSPEVYARAGGTPAAFVAYLYDRILDRTPSAGDVAYWTGQLAVRSGGSVAADMFASRESRTGRVTALYHGVLGRAPDAAGLSYWVDRLATTNDVMLAASLASSPEFLSRAQVGCTVTPPPPSSGPYTLTGRGFGHGRGMGQWGALGYAVDHGWSGSQILDHFYSGTTAGTAANSTQRVYLVGSQGSDLTVTQSAGSLQVGGLVSSARAVSVRRLSATTFRVYRSSTASCAGPWTHAGDTTASEVTVASAVAQGEDGGRMLRDCRTSRSYRGDLRAVRALGSVVTVNRVATEAMLRGIVPTEVSPSWATAGGGAGAAAVRAQAVAARSYMLAGDTRWSPFATTCDSTTCQSYQGFGAEHPLTDTAIAATAGQVRRHAGGAIARTEFGASSGGWTAGGEFPAVVDLGDDHSGNPNHTWSTTVTAAQVAAAFPGNGAFLGFGPAARDGNGALGGRVLTIRLLFSGGAITRTGEQVRSALGLRSSWFAPT